MKKRYPTLMFSLAFLLAAFPESRAEKPPERSPGLEVLARFEGTWNHVITIQPPGAKESVHRTVSTRSWSAGGSFLRFEEVNREEPHFDEFQMVLTHDPAAKKYTGVIMDGTTRSKVSATWDEASKTMKFDAEDENGNRLRYTLRFLDENTAEASGAFSDGEGNVIVKIRWKHSRQE